MDIEQLIDNMTFIEKHILVSGKEAGEGLKAFGKIIEQFYKLSPVEQKQFLIDGFRKIYNEDKTACEEFARRHPESWLNEHIPK